MMKEPTERMSRNYALALLNVLAEYKEHNFSLEHCTGNLREVLLKSKQQIDTEKYDYDELVSYKMPPEYGDLIRVTHKEGDWEERVTNGIEEMENVAKTYLEHDFYNMTSTELKNIGFKVWEGDLHLIPAYLIRVFSDNDIVECIDGTKGPIRDADRDIRMGCIAYGIRTKAIIT